MLATLLRLVPIALAVPVVAASSPPDTETGSLTFRPRSSSLAAAMAEVKSGRELAVLLTDAPPASVEFVRFDEERSVLVYRDRKRNSTKVGRLEDMPSQRIEAVRLVETHKHPGHAVLGLIGGAIFGATLGYLAGASDGDRDEGLEDTAAAGGGMLLGSVTGLILGLTLPDGKRTEKLVWQREGE